MRTKVFRKVIASILAVLMTFYSIELAGIIAAYAANDKDKEQIELLDCIPEEAEKRSKHIKHLDQFDTENIVAYLNDDDTTTFYVFQSPIRYKDKGGKLTEYDNTLVEIEDNKMREEGYKYKNKASDIEVLFPEHLQGAEGVKIRNSEYSIEIIPVPLLENDQDSVVQVSPTPEISETPTITPDTSETPTLTPTLEEFPEPTASTTVTPSPEASETPTSVPSPTASFSPTPESTSTDVLTPSPEETPVSSPTETESSVPTTEPTPEESSETTSPPEPSGDLDLSNIVNLSLSKPIPLSGGTEIFMSSKYSCDTATIVTYDKTEEKEIDSIWGDYEPKKDVEKKYKAKIKEDERGKEDKKADYKSSESSKITYSYSVIDRGIKENIIIDSYTGQNAFDFIITAPDLDINIVDNKIIELVDKNGNIVSRSGKLFANDSEKTNIRNDNVHYTEDVAVELFASNNKNEYRVRLTVSEEFLSSDSTVYPVTIDPTFTFTYRSSMDQFVYKYNSLGYYNTGGDIIVGARLYYDISHGMIKPDLDAFFELGISSEDIVKVDYHTYQAWGTGMTMEMYQLHNDWGPLNWIYYEQGPWDTNCTYQSSINLSANTWYELDITNMAKSWNSYANGVGGSPNYGFKLKGQNDTYPLSVGLNSNEASYNRPYVTIEHNGDVLAPGAVSNIRLSSSGFEEDENNPGKFKATLIWDGTFDYPTGGYLNSGVDEYLVYYSTDGENYTPYDSTWIEHIGENIQHEKQLVNLDSGQEYSFKVVARDNDGNTQTIDGAGQSSVFLASDLIAPSAPKELTVSPNTWTEDTSPWVSWTGINKSSENDIITMQYAVDNTNSWYDFATLAEGTGINTEYDNIITNSDFDSGTIDWLCVNIVDNVLFASNNILTSTGNGSGSTLDFVNDIGVTATAGDKIFVSCYARVTNPDCDYICMLADGTTEGTEVLSSAVTTPEQNHWYQLNDIIKVGTDFTGNLGIGIRHKYADSTIANGKIMEIDGSSGHEVIAYNLTQMYGAGNEPNLESCKIIFDPKIENVVLNSNFEDGTTDYGATGSGTLFANGNVLTVTGTGNYNWVDVCQTTQTDIAAGNKIYYRVIFRVTNSDCNYVGMRVCGSWAGDSENIVLKVNPVEDTWYDVSGIYEVEEGNTGKIRFYINHNYANAATAVGKRMQINGRNVSGIYIANLSEMFGEGNEPDSEMFEQIFNRNNNGEIANGDFSSGTSDWDVSSVSASVTSNIMSVTGNSYSSNCNRVLSQVSADPGDKILVQAKVRATDANADLLRLGITDTSTGYSECNSISEPNANEWYDLHFYTIMPDSYEDTFDLFIDAVYPDGTTANGSTFEIDGTYGVKMINLTDNYGSYNEPIINTYLGLLGENVHEEAKIDLSDLGLSDGQHTIYVRARDDAYPENNISDYTSVNYYLDRNAPEAELNVPSTVNSTVGIEGTASDTGSLASWEIRALRGSRSDYTDIDFENIISNSDFSDGTTDWLKYFGPLSVNNNILSLTGDGSAPYPVVYQDTDVAAVAGELIYMSIKVRVTNPDCEMIYCQYDGTIDGTQTVIPGMLVQNPIENEWYELSGILVIPQDFAGNIRAIVYNIYEDSISANGKKMEIDGNYGVMVYNLTDIFGTENEPDAETCDILRSLPRYPNSNLQNIVDNSDFSNGTIGYGTIGSTHEVANNILSNTGDATVSYPDEYHITEYSVAEGHKLYGKIRARVTNDTCDHINFFAQGSSGGTYQVFQFHLTPTQNEWYELSGIITTPEDFSGNYKLYIQHFYADAASASGKVMNIDGNYGVVLIDLTEIYGAGNEPDKATCDLMYSTIAQGTQSITNGQFCQLDVSNLPSGDYELCLNVKDEAGHETESFASFTKRVGTAITSPALTLTTPDPSVDPISVFDESPYEILYTGDGTGGSAGLYVDGILVDDDDSDGLTLDIINGDYDEGESHFLYVKADDSGTIKYSAKTYNTVTQDLFDDTSMLETLDTNAEVTSGKLTLKETGGVYATNTNTVIQSNDVFDALVENAYVESVTFEVNDNIPTGTIISYEISNNGTDFVSVADEQTINFATVGTQIVVKATLNTTDSSVAPEILDWTVDVTQVDKGAEFVVKLVDEPTNVNAEPQVNYKTLIKWEDAVNPEGTTYKVYRVDCDNYDEDFDIQDGTLVGENIESTFFYDYNLNFDKTFSYKVIAVVNMGTLENPIYRESILSEYATASTMDSDEFDKRLGLQDYWRYTGFVTGSGSGQIELSQGNLSYQTTDFVFPGPMFVMTMRRTYNSQSTSKTALGYGTDFSFNTTLMMEYDEYETEVGVILKDGDGTIHRFIKNGSTYDSPTGVLMELSYDAQNEQWIISRKDGVSYIFDNNMMMYRLQDRNGNYLEYDYDEQGNIDTITDNAGNYITFAYNEYGLIDTVTVEGPDPMDSNDERVYKYSYTTDAMGKVRLAKRGLEGEIYFDEEFEYDSTTGELENIIDGEEHVYTIYYTSGEDTIIEIEYPIDDPITESFEISYGTNTTSVSFRGNNTVYAYDTNGCVTGITNSLGYTTTYGYDATSWQIDEVEYYNKVGASTTEEAITTAVVYDSYDNISIVTDDQGNTIEYDYIDPATQSYSLFDMPYSVTITSEDETESITTEYTYDTNGNVLTEVEANVTVATNTYYSGAWVDETNMGYPGQLHTSTDRYGSVTSYEYTVEGWLYRIYDDDDNYTEYEYDGMGNPIYITDAEGNITKTDYDLIGRKIKVYYTDGDNDFTDGTNDTEWWVYNNNHNVTHHYVGTGTEEVVTRYTYDDMNRMVKTYHNSNLYPEMTVNYDYYEVETGKYAQKVSYTDKEGIESAEYYDAIGRLIETRMVNGASYTNVTSYDYDKAGNMIEVTDGEGRVVEAQYDELNRTIATIADPSGLAYTTEHGYDYLSRETIVTDGEGAVTKYEYDDFNRLTKVTQSPDWTPDIYMDSIDLSSYGVPDMRNGIFSSDGTNLYIVDNGNTIIKQFTLSIPWDITTASFVTGNYFSVSSQMPAPRAIEFNSDGTKMYVGCYTNGRIYEYNLSTPWLVNTATYSNVSLDISSFVFSIQSMTFNSTGTILIVCDFSNANIKRYDLSTAWDISSATISNKTGNVATQTASPQSLAITSDGTMAWVLNNGLDDDATIIHKYTLSTAWDPSTMVYTNESEDITDKVEVRSGRGLVFGDDEYFCVFSTNDDSVYQYHIDQPITEIFETVYEYEVNVPGTTEDDDYIVNQVVDAEDGIKQTWFDNLGRVYKEVNDGTDDEDDLIIESVYHYDALGRMTYKEFADGTILGKEYDAKGNLWKEKYYQDFDDYDDEDNDDSPEDEADRTYTDYTLYVDYDSRGNLKRAEGEVDGEEFYHEWAYDTRDRVTQQKEYVSLNSNTAQNIISYSYWDNGQLKSVTYPATFADEYSSVSQKYYYNSYGQLSDIMMDTQDARSYYYDDSGRVIRTDTYIDLVDTGNIMSAYYTYDDTGLTTDIQYKLNGTLKERCQYIYDDNGMITTETINPYDSSTTILKTHTYDDIGRLTETTIDSTTYAYTYDAIGNRLTESDGTDSRTYEYNELFQLEQINKNSVKEFEYIYNDIGGQINQKEYDSSETLIEEQTFTYHENGLLKNVLIEDSDGEDPDKNEYYMYNGQEQRIVKEFNDGTDTTMTRYMYTGSEVIMTANSAGIKTTENILTPSGEIVSSQRFNENGNGTGWYSYNYDIRKSTTTIVASSGFAENYYEYDAFGETDATESLLNEIEFTGATSDSNTGLYYMNARYYNPNTGRFISQDSYKGSAYEPWTQNLYVYTGNNPVNFIDPTGFAPIYIDFFFGGSGDVDTSTPPTGPSNIVSDPEEDTDADTSSGGSGAGSGSGNNNTGSGLSLTDNMKDAGVEIIEIDGKEYYDYTNPVYLAITAAGNEAHYHIYNPLWFYNKVNHGKPYDIKREQPWNETIGEGTYPGSYDTEIYFWSGLTTPEKLGNIMYGYVGAASLFSDKTLYKGSIFASGINRTPDVKQEDITNEMVDHYYIRLGIKWYEEAIYDKSIFYR